MIGKINFAPGTIASFFACILFFILSIFMSYKLILILTFLIFVYSLFAINNVLPDFKSKDPSEIVIDEVIGQFIVLIFIPVYQIFYPVNIILYYGSSFFLFRFFDIIKPYPANYVDQNTKGSLGVVLDDIIAGIYTVIVLCIIFYLIGSIT